MHVEEKKTGHSGKGMVSSVLGGIFNKKAMSEFESMKKGEVVWFDPGKGYGFVRDNESAKEYFVHYSKILGPTGEFKTLTMGDKVTFDLMIVEREGGEEKIQAKDVTVYEHDTSQPVKKPRPAQKS